MFVETSYTIPDEATASLAAFRRWALSDDSPSRGRFDFIDSEIEVEWEPEDFFTHGTLKGELLRGISDEIGKAEGGYLFTRARFSCPATNLSAQPDGTFVSVQSVESGRIGLMPKPGGEAWQYVELEGPPDLVVEVVSDSTVRKDTKRLPHAYFAAGVTEFWLVDGRKDLTFVLHARGESGYEPVAADAEGFQPSAVLGTSFRLDRTKDRLGAWQYDLVSR